MDLSIHESLNGTVGIIEGHRTIATVWDFDDALPTAQLLAAAPDLLAALETIEVSLFVGPGNSKSQILNQVSYCRGVARAAIARARGEAGDDK